jgi:hypothetical protein
MRPQESLVPYKSFNTLWWKVYSTVHHICITHVVSYNAPPRFLFLHSISLSLPGYNYKEQISFVSCFAKGWNEKSEVVDPWRSILNGSEFSRVQLQTADFLIQKKWNLFIQYIYMLCLMIIPFMRHSMISAPFQCTYFLLGIGLMQLTASHEP